MNSTKRLLAIAVCATLSGAAVAQTGGSPASGDRGIASPSITSPTGGGGNAPESPVAAATHVLKAARLSKLDGVNIYDSSSKKIGEVKDFVLDPASGRVVHALVSIGGVLGIGDKEYEVPANQLKVFSRASDDAVPLKIELGAAPDTLTPARKLDKDSPYVMGSTLIGTDVNDSGGKEAGEVEDAIVDLQSGEVRYVLIEFDESWSVKDKLFAFPMSEMKRDKSGKDMTLNVNKEALGGKPSIEKSKLDKVDLSDSSWLQAAGGGAAGAAGGTTGGASAAAGNSPPSQASPAGSTPAGGSIPGGGSTPAGGSTPSGSPNSPGGSTK